MILLLKIQALKLKNRLFRSRGPERIKAAAFAGLGLLFFAFLHWGAFRFLRAVHGVELAGPLLLVKILSMALMTAFFMIFFSATITSFTTLFFARDLSLLVHTPMSHRTLFAYKLIETAVYASWMMVLALVPFLAAYGRVTGQGAGFYFFLIALGVPFVWLASAGGIGLSLGLMRLFPARRVREIMLALSVVICTGLYLWVRWLAPARFLRADTMGVALEYIALLEAPSSPWLPSTWFAQAAAAFINGAARDAGLYGGTLLSAAALAFVALVAVGARTYYAGWASAQEAPRRKTRRPLGDEWRWVPSLFGARFRAILGKDFAVFFRDSNQWSQLLMLASVAAIYLLSIHKLPLDSRFLKGLVSFLNIGMTGFVLASVALRFLFPAVSLEGKSWWALRAAPVSLWEILWSKFLGGGGAHRRFGRAVGGRVEPFSGGRSLCGAPVQRDGVDHGRHAFGHGRGLRGAFPPFRRGERGPDSNVGRRGLVHGGWAFLRGGDAGVGGGPHAHALFFGGGGPFPVVGGGRGAGGGGLALVERPGVLPSLGGGPPPFGPRRRLSSDGRYFPFDIIFP